MRISTPLEIEAAEARRLEREEQRAQQEFEKRGWSKWRVFSWISYRTPSLICRIENRSDLGVLRRHYKWDQIPDSAALRHHLLEAQFIRDRRPHETLLRAPAG
jgi:hypothetical protein